MFTEIIKIFKYFLFMDANDVSKPATAAEGFPSHLTHTHTHTTYSPCVARVKVAVFICKDFHIRFLILFRIPKLDDLH